MHDERLGWEDFSSPTLEAHFVDCESFDVAERGSLGA